METKIVENMGQKSIVTKTDYDLGIEFLNHLLENHRAEVDRLFLSHLGRDTKWYSYEKMKSELKNVIKSHNANFIRDLSVYIVANDKPIRGNIDTVMGGETKTFFSPTFNSSGDGDDLNFWQKIFGTKESRQENKAIRQANRQERKDDKEFDKSMAKYRNSDSESTDSKETKEKDPFDWNKAMDTTGKVAQSIFYLGSIFSNKEGTPTPTIEESDVNVQKTSSNMTINVIIGVIVLAVVITIGYFIFKPKK